MTVETITGRTRFVWIALALAPVLMGCSPSLFQAAYGGGVAVASRDEDPPAIAETIDDRSITLAVNRAWLDVSRTRFADLDLLVNDGTVVVSGSVASPDDLITALEIVWRQDGVAAVDSKATYGATETDLVLASDIHSRLSADPEVEMDGFTIKVFDQSVYVIGRARSRSELNRVLRHIRSSGPIPRVVSLVTVNQSGV